jgi:hypothetical protein
MVMFLGIGAVWPQSIALAGDYTQIDNRARLIAKALFMMTFGGAVIYAVLMQIPEYGGLYVIMGLPAAWPFPAPAISPTSSRGKMKA